MLRLVSSIRCDPNTCTTKSKKGNSYLNPDIDIIADDSLNEESKSKLSIFLNKWLINHINDVLGDLIKLTKHQINNQYFISIYTFMFF